MSKPSATFEHEELNHLRQQLQQANLRERQNLLKDFLGEVKAMMADQAKLHLPETLEEHQRLAVTQTQVFLSYAWEIEGTTKFTHLQTFLKYLAENLTQAGLIPWLDLQRMTGDLEVQMRSNIKQSQYILLIGTHRYAERTKPGVETNVSKELKFALDEYRQRAAQDEKSADFLLPLMFDGDYNATFATINKFLIRDCRSWHPLETGQWQSFENYVKELTQFEPLGILPTMLGISRLEPKLLQYRQACREQYIQRQKAFINNLKLLTHEKRELDEKFRIDPLAHLAHRPQTTGEIKREKKVDWENKYPVPAPAPLPQFTSQSVFSSLSPLSPQASLIDEKENLAGKTAYELAKKYHEEKNYVKAREQYEFAWSKKITKAGVKLAILLIRGQGSKETEKQQDQIRAASLLIFLAASGDTLAMKNLAEAYRYGVGTAKDEKEAAKWQKQYEHACRKVSTNNIAFHNEMNHPSTHTSATQQHKQINNPEGFTI
ncbi:MAG: toll/interleukin-1 receptor domain-containing protein [Proteobacteria bacterium]|nr:toll/interleukin-1 receptor domain-containing protein [Pseudomonadota bacterium]